MIEFNFHILKDLNVQTGFSIAKHVYNEIRVSFQLSIIDVSNDIFKKFCNRSDIYCFSKYVNLLLHFVINEFRLKKLL